MKESKVVWRQLRNWYLVLMDQPNIDISVRQGRVFPLKVIY
jgi:hypothetical protein